MFHLLKNLKPTYTWPVIAAVPSDGGKVEVIKFDAVFNRLSADRVRELQDPENDNRPKTDVVLIKEILFGIKCKDESGAYGDVSEADSAELHAVVGVNKAIVMAYYTSLTGEKIKN